MSNDWLDLCTSLTERSEGCVLTAYPDPGSGGEPWTIGYGATGPGITQGTVWTQDQATADLRKRLTALGAQIDAIVHVALTPGQKAALVDFAYNLGLHALQESTLLRLLNRGNYVGAADQFGLWVYASGRVMPGLVTRRAAERSLFLS